MLDIFLIYLLEILLGEGDGFHFTQYSCQKYMPNMLPNKFLMAKRGSSQIYLPNFLRYSPNICAHFICPIHFNNPARKTAIICYIYSYFLSGFKYLRKRERL